MARQRRSGDLLLTERATFDQLRAQVIDVGPPQQCSRRSTWPDLHVAVDLDIDQALGEEQRMEATAMCDVDSAILKELVERVGRLQEQPRIGILSTARHERTPG